MTTHTATGKKIIVTSALPYVNNVPHLGNLVCVISADVYTRFLRLKKANVISVLGTDEHGTTSETKALEEGLTPKELCDKYAKIHKEIYDWFKCDFDCYGRTSSKDNAEVTIDIFNKLHKNGYIAKDTLEQLYCEKDARFLADRYVEGTCPKCNYEHARGDQCEQCGTLLNAHELVNPKCKICKNTPVIKKTTHLFIDLPKLEPALRDWIMRVDKNWSDNARTMTHAWLKEGLRQRCITRDLKWGISVPLQGFEDKVFYSWFDAPIGYIGITKENKKDWKDYWFNPEHTRLVQFMGKDNIPFHTILFPSFLIGTKDDYTLMTDISVNEFLNYEQGQFSKSRSVGVFGDDAIATGISPDVFRYYLMVNRPEKTDTEFSWDDFQKKNNAEIVANIGNLVNRTITFLNRFYDSKVPHGVLDENDKTFWEEVRSKEHRITQLLDEINIKEALREIMQVGKFGNQYLQENEPWKNPDEKRKAACLYLLANLVKDLALLIAPYMPQASQRILQQLQHHAGSWDDLGTFSIAGGHTMGTAALLFKKIEDKEISEFRKRFAGTKTGVATEAKTGIADPGTAKSTAAPVPSTAAPSSVFAQNPFNKLQLRIAEIVNVKKHSSAEKLYIEEIDLGDEKRTIVSGLVPYYREDELLGKKIIVVTNLEPAKLRGVESNGMLLAAEEHGVVGLLLPQGNIGEYIYQSGNDQKVNESLLETVKSLPKIKIDEFFQTKIIVKNKTVFCDDRELVSLSGGISVDKVSHGAVR